MDGTVDGNGESQSSGQHDTAEYRGVIERIRRASRTLLSTPDTHRRVKKCMPSLQLYAADKLASGRWRNETGLGLDKYTEAKEFATWYNLHRDSRGPADAQKACPASLSASMHRPLGTVLTPPIGERAQRLFQGLHSHIRAPSACPDRRGIYPVRLRHVCEHPPGLPSLLRPPEEDLRHGPRRDQVQTGNL